MLQLSSENVFFRCSILKKKKKDDDFSFRGMSQKEPQRRVKREIGEESTNGI